MEDSHSLFTLDSQGSKIDGSRDLEGQSADTESQESMKSYTFLTKRCRGTHWQEGVMSTMAKHQLEFSIGAGLKNR